MNRDELLDKLAMELGEWPADSDTLWPIFVDIEGWQESMGMLKRPGDGPVTMQDWLQRRAELINRPSWDDAPEWATHLCQNGDGEWKWYPQEPYTNEVCGGVWCHDANRFSPCRPNQLATQGAIPAGHDWRQTLERRPITTSLGATDFDEDRSDILGQNGNDGLHYMTEEEQELPTEERHDCDRCGGSWWSPHNTECPCQASRSDGSTASYYELPEGATELQELISYRNLNSQDGEIFRAIYRKGRASHSDALRDAKKVLFYAQAEVERLERYGQ